MDREAGLGVSSDHSAIMYPGPIRRHPHNLNSRRSRRWRNSWSKQWGATMVLTRPDAGSGISASRAKAFDNGDGTWRIEGVSGSSPAEHDMSDNIIHLVLARPEGVASADPAPKVWSLFVVPKFMFDVETGESSASLQRGQCHQRRESMG